MIAKKHDKSLTHTEADCVGNALRGCFHSPTHLLLVVVSTGQLKTQFAEREPWTARKKRNAKIVTVIAHVIVVCSCSFKATLHPHVNEIVYLYPFACLPHCAVTLNVKSNTERHCNNMLMVCLNECCLAFGCLQQL